MFEYTHGALNKIIDDFKKIWLGVHIGLQLFTILYLVYMHLTRRGFFIINTVLLALALGYFIFFIVMEFVRAEKKTKRTVREIYAWCKRIIRLFTITLTIYGLFVVSKDFTPISLLLLILMIFGFILDILLYFIIKFLTAEKDLLMAGVKRDVDELKKPIQSVGNFFKRITGNEVEEEPVLSKADKKRYEILDIQAEKLKEKKAQGKTTKLEKKKAEKERQKQEKLEKKLQKKQTQRIPAPVENEKKVKTEREER